MTDGERIQADMRTIAMLEEKLRELEMTAWEEPRRVIAPRATWRDVAPVLAVLILALLSLAILATAKL